MTLRHIINWEGKHSNVTSNVDSRNLNQLKTKFTKSITRFDLILYSLQSSDYNQTRKSVNRVIRNEALSIPSGELFTLHNNMPDFFIYLRSLCNVSQTHSAYALLAARLVCEFCKIPLVKFARLTVGEYNKGSISGVDITLPFWLSVILDRQKKIALSIGMTDDDPLLFVMRWSDFNKTSLQARAIKVSDPEVTDTLYKFRIKYGYAVSDYIDKFILFCGMKHNAILQVLPPEYTGTKFNSDRSIYGKLVTIYEYDEKSKRRKICIFGYIIWAYKGVYLVHTNNGLLWCPYYLLGQPTIRPGRYKDNQLKLDLHKLGYNTLEFYENIKDHKTLRSHVIERRLL